MKNSAVIYAIVNKSNNHRYIGSAVDFESRKRIHLHHLRNGKHHSQYLQHAYNKYGESEFEFVILAHCRESELIRREQEFIDSYNPEYNISPTAGSSLGIKRSDIAKKNSSESQRKRFGNPLQRLAHSIAHLGHAISNEQRLKISKSLRGHVVAEETRLKISEAQRGKPKSEESRRRMSVAKQGTKMPLKTRKKISVSLKRTRNKSN